MVQQRNDDKSNVQKDIAVALGYDAKSMTAPKVLAAAKGHVAHKIIEKARQNNIPVERDPMLAEALNQLEIGQEIPAELYKVVAEILVFIMETNRRYTSSQK
ncbi:MAG TPA: EscU/YscU/HrcU family type III secretion system export apparatus switch protein [Desulfobacteria bacterium]|nr:EscU/YscU/HrcU family type III secretion system export apparatus switch protein [Desulfobacteria bacterium]